MASRTPGEKKPGKIGDMKVEETKMKPNVPNQELSTDGYTLMGEAVIQKLKTTPNIVYKPKKPKKPKK
tara:strand:+ start:5767 stop:5970 length:204 start_codon:yes stop_codon:yes gene_type:complete